ncbi:hypothetical protein F2P79_014095 [Pimephales promelas]|nr:hypothetical protein F2P79_014095 [Pimephales promelas]
MANSWILTVIVLLSIFGPGSHTRGEHTVSHPNQEDAIEQKLSDFKEQIFVEGSDVSLWCADNVTDVKWNELQFIVWNIIIRLETRLDIEHGQRIAVCEASYKNTKPTLHWEPALNFSFIDKQLDKFFIIESRVHLPDNVINSNLACVASYPSVSGSLRQKSTLHIPTNDKDPQTVGRHTFSAFALPI